MANINQLPPETKRMILKAILSGQIKKTDFTESELDLSLLLVKELPLFVFHSQKNKMYDFMGSFLTEIQYKQLISFYNALGNTQPLYIIEQDEQQ